MHNVSFYKSLALCSNPAIVGQPAYVQHFLLAKGVPTQIFSNWIYSSIVLHFKYEKMLNKMHVKKLLNSSSYPFCKALLPLGLVKLYCFSPRYKLNQDNPKWINISFLCDLASLSIFWSQVPIEVVWVISSCFAPILFTLFGRIALCQASLFTQKFQ